MMDHAEMRRRGTIRGAVQLQPADCEVLARTATPYAGGRLVEIGACFGTSTMLLGTLAREAGGRLYTIEPRVRPEWHRNIADAGIERTVTLIEGYSPWVDLPVSGIDYLFIDGEHQTRWALVDYHYWFPWVRLGGAIAFHDITGPPGPKVRRALDIILESDADKLTEIDRTPADQRHGGVVVYRKERS